MSDYAYVKCYKCCVETEDVEFMRWLIWRTEPGTYTCAKCGEKFVVEFEEKEDTPK